MPALKLLLTVNGAVFVVRGLINLVRPTSFYLEADAPAYAQDAVRVLGVTYATLGAVQLWMAVAGDRSAVRTVAGASMLFAAAVATQAALQRSGSADAFHRLRLGAAAENGLVAGLYATLLSRQRLRAPD
jgi:multisubunit Na+/H+ antiporter MnhG subunit